MVHRELQLTVDSCGNFAEVRSPDLFGATNQTGQSRKSETAVSRMGRLLSSPSGQLIRASRVFDLGFAFHGRLHQRTRREFSDIQEGTSTGTGYDG